MKKLFRSPAFWFIAALLALISVPHYQETIKHPQFIPDLYRSIGLTRHSFERILFLAPIVWSSFFFGRTGAMITSLVALAIMVPRALFLSMNPVDALFEIAAVFILGNVVALSFEWLSKERKYRAQLESAQIQLESQIKHVTESEHRLATLNEISNTVSRSLDLGQVLHSAIDKVVAAVNADFGLVFLLDESAGGISLAAHKGVSVEFVRDVGRMRSEEGFNGRVITAGEALPVEDASADAAPLGSLAGREGLRSAVIVPLRSREKPNGTLYVGVRRERGFRKDEIDLLAAMGVQIGIAVEKAHLYEQEHRTAERLRISEQRYRYLFDNASDAIWVHDMRGNIVDANKAAERLNGYTKEEFIGMNVRDFLTEEFLVVARDIQQRMLGGEEIAQPYEQRLIRKDGTVGTMKMATSPVVIDGVPVGFQHIARDVTEEKKLQENMRFYVQQVTRAQEEERKRISRELHDETIQDLVVLSRRIDDLATSDSSLPEWTKARLEQLRQETNRVMTEVRRLSQDLRPAALDRLGLRSALEWLASNVTEYSGIAVTLKVMGNERRLPEEEELIIFRIVQEALRNVWRHSHAKNASVTVEFGERLKVTVTDDGAGFAPPGTMGDLARDGKLGLAGMQERARLLGGTVSVASASGRGTTVTVDIEV